MSIQKDTQCDCHDKIIKFLQTENQQLKESNNDYSQLVRMNKDIIKNLQQINNNTHDQQFNTQMSQNFSGAPQVNVLSNNNNQNNYVGMGNAFNNINSCVLLNNNNQNAKENANYNFTNANNQPLQQSSNRYAQAQSMISSMQSMRFNPIKEKTVQTASKGEKTTACTTTKSETNKVYEILFAQIAEENNTLYEIIQRISKQRDVAQSKVLINEQIAEGIEQQEKELIYEYSDKLTSMSRVIEDQQIQIQLLQSQNTKGQTQFGSYIRYREIILAKDTEVKLNNRLESSLKLIRSLDEKISLLEEEKNELILLNGILGQQLDKARQNNQGQAYEQTVEQYPSSSKIQFTQESQKNITVDLNKGIEKRYQDSKIKKIDNQEKAINTIKKVINMDTQESDDMFIPDVLPDRVKLLKQDDNQNKVYVPQLDLSKAKKIQEINLQRQLEQLKQKEQMQATQQLKQQISKDHPTDQSNPNAKITEQNQPKLNELDMKLLEKYKLVENEMFKAKAFLEEEILRQQVLQKLLQESERKVQELEAVNVTLIESNMLFQSKWKKLWDSYIYYREYYQRDSIKTNKHKKNKSTDSKYKFNNLPNFKEVNNSVQPAFIFATQNYEYQYCQGNDIQQMSDFCSPESLCRQAQRNKSKQCMYMIASPKTNYQTNNKNQGIGQQFQSPLTDNIGQGYQGDSENINQPLVQPISETQLLEIASEYFLSQRANKIPAIYDKSHYTNNNNNNNNQNLLETKAQIVNLALELYLDTQRRCILQRIQEGKKFRKRSKSLDLIQTLNDLSFNLDSGKKNLTLKKIKEHSSRIRFPPHQSSQNQSFQQQGLSAQNTKDTSNIGTFNQFKDIKKVPQEMKVVYNNHVHHCCLCNEKVHRQCHDLDENSLQLGNPDHFEAFEELIDQMNEQEKTFPKQNQNQPQQQIREEIPKTSNQTILQLTSQGLGQQNQNENRILCQDKIMQQKELIKGHTGDIITSSIDNNVSPDGVGITIMPNPNHYNKYFKTDLNSKNNNCDYIQDELTKINGNNSNQGNNNNIIVNQNVNYMINIIPTNSNMDNQISPALSSCSSVRQKGEPSQDEYDDPSNSEQVICDLSNSITGQEQNIDNNNENSYSQQCKDRQEFNLQNQQEERIQNQNGQQTNCKSINNYQYDQQMVLDYNDQNKFIYSNESGERSEVLQENKCSSSAPFHPSESKSSYQQKYHFNGQDIDYKNNLQNNNNNITNNSMAIQNIPNLSNNNSISKISTNYLIQAQPSNSLQNKSHGNENNNIEVSELQLIVFD